MPGQSALFATHRDWSALVATATADLPALTGTDHALLNDFEDMMRAQRWEASRRYASLRTLTAIISWLGADAPVPETDVHALAGLDDSMTAKRVCSYLRSRGLLQPDPHRAKDRNQMYIDTVLAELPQPIATEVSTWVAVLRGEGRRKHPALTYGSIRRYLATLQPVLDEWISHGVTSLREITDQQANRALTARRGNPARNRLTVLRSCFRALKQERIIFRDPTQALTMTAVEILPQTVPSDYLAGLLDLAHNSVQRVIMALVAIHALPGCDIARLRSDDLDLSAGRLLVRRSHQHHTLYLEKLTHQLIGDWMAERYRRWPTSTNPHLLVTAHTALDPAGPSISVEVLRKTFAETAMNMRQLRQDRILDEAFTTADPLRLMRLFGITEGTAMRYIAAAHPEKTAKPLR